MTRNEAREAVMQILYELDVTKAIRTEEAKSKATAFAEERLSKDKRNWGIKLINHILDDIDDIDTAISSCSTGWKISRMPKVDLAVLRLACGEVRFCDDIPDAVTVNEAINIAKKFSTEKSAGFIHGVLAAILKNHSS